jgi:hypothetical protein
VSAQRLYVSGFLSARLLLDPTLKSRGDARLRWPGTILAAVGPSADRTGRADRDWEIAVASSFEARRLPGQPPVARGGIVFVVVAHLPLMSIG